MATLESQAGFWRAQRTTLGGEAELTSAGSEKFPLTWRILRLHTMAEEPDKMADELTLILIEIRRPNLWPFILSGMINIFIFLTAVFGEWEVIDLWVVMPGSNVGLWLIKFVATFGCLYALTWGVLHRVFFSEKKHEAVSALIMACGKRDVLSALRRLQVGEQGFIVREINHLFPFSIRPRRNK